MTTTLRGLGTADIPGWNRLLAAIEKVDRTGEHYNEADLAEEMANPDIEPGKDIVGAFEGDEMVGYFSVYARSAAGGPHKIQLDGGVRPDARGRVVGTTLATAMRARAQEVHQERHPEVPALLTAGGVSGNGDQAALMKDIGLTPAVELLDASRPVPSARDSPPGARGSGAAAVRPLARGRHAHRPQTPPSWTTRTSRPGRRACGSSGSPGAAASARSSASSWSTGTGRAGGRLPADQRVRRTSRRPAGARPTSPRSAPAVSAAAADWRARSSPMPSTSTATPGSTRPPGRGLRDPTGALGIYERAGFEVTTRFTDYVARVPAAEP